MKISGLRQEEVLELRKIYGSNTIDSAEKVSGWTIFFQQFKNPLIYILLGVGAISLFFRDIFQFSLVLGVVFLNVTMGFFQEYNAQKALDALKRIIEPKANVIRDGSRKIIEAREIVPGDNIILSAGDKAPGDGIILESFNLLVDESILTGESEPVAKNLEDDKNIFAGTTILAGRAIIEINKIGCETQIGRIGKGLAEIDKGQTPLQKSLEDFSHNLLYLVIVVCIIIFIFAVFYGTGILKALELSTVLAVAAIPEGLPVAITLLLALSMRRISRKNGLVRRLISIETLGVTSVICTDKTGTLTQGRMKVVKVDFVDEKLARMAMVLNNDRKNGIELALWEHIAADKSIKPEEIAEAVGRKFELGFDSERKYMVTAHSLEKKDIIFAKGAPEVIMEMCVDCTNGEDIWREKIHLWAEEGLRILAFAYKYGEKYEEKANYHWLGLVGVEDPLREDASDALREAEKMGIKVKIVTGDHMATARNVAKRLNFSLQPHELMNGEELDKFGVSALAEKIRDIKIFARTTPSQKLKIIQALQQKGEIVAMTGDGVNDALALKKADIGVAIGSGSDVAKEAGDLIILDNAFKTIVAACEEGRIVFQNLKKVVGYTLSNSFAEIFLILGAMLLNLPAPLTIAQILWIHFICDGPMDLLLGFEPMEKNLKKINPKILAREEILDNPMKLLIFGISFVTGILAFLMFWHFYRSGFDINYARTVAFCTLAVADLVYVFSFKSLKTSLIRTEKFFSNVYLFWGVASGLAMVCLALYFPPISGLLETKPIGILPWAAVGIVSIIDIFLVELMKSFNARRIVSA